MRSNMRKPCCSLGEDMPEPLNNPYQVTRAEVDDLAPAEERGEKPMTVSVAVVMLWLSLIIQLAGLVWAWQLFTWGPTVIRVLLIVMSAIWLFLAYLVAMIERGGQLGPHHLPVVVRAVAAVLCVVDLRDFVGLATGR